jgi:hypothetical protein
MTEALNTNAHLQLLIVDPAPQVRGPSSWPRHRVLKLNVTLREALETDRVQTTIQALSLAERDRVSAYQSLPSRQPDARRSFTSAVTYLLSIGHLDQAWEVVREGRRVAPNPPQQEMHALVMNPKDWAAHLPPLDHPAAAAWWGVGRYHLNALEMTVLDVVADNIGKQAVASDFRRANTVAPWMGSPNEEDLAHFQRQIGLRADPEAGGSLLEPMRERLEELSEVRRAGFGGESELGDAAVERLITYCAKGSIVELVDKLVTKLPWIG